MTEDSKEQQDDIVEELIPFDSAGAPPASLHNFDGDDMARWRMKAFATGAGCKDGADLIGQTFPLKYWFVHKVTVNNPERGPVEAVRTVLIDATGTAYGFVSGGIYKSLRDMVQELGPGPYDPGLLITVTERKSQNNRRVYTIEPAPDRIADKPTGM